MYQMFRPRLADVTNRLLWLAFMLNGTSESRLMHTICCSTSYGCSTGCCSAGCCSTGCCSTGCCSASKRSSRHREGIRIDQFRNRMRHRFGLWEAALKRRLNSFDPQRQWGMRRKQERCNSFTEKHVTRLTSTSIREPSVLFPTTDSF